MLEHLVAYARSHDLVAEPGFAPKLVRWAVLCTPDGRFADVLDLAEPDDPRRSGRPFRRCPELLQPEMKRGGPGCRPFLVDSAEVLALLDAEDDPKAVAKHAYFVDLLRRASEVAPALAGVAAVLDDPAMLAEVRARLAAQKAKPTDRVTPALQDEHGLHFPVELDDWHDWWRAFRRSLADQPAAGRRRRSSETPARVRCLASGELVVPAATHPKIAGLTDVGGIAMGDALVSFKQESFCSYGLAQSANAPVSEGIAGEYRAALNHILRRQSVKLSRARVAYWFKEQVPFDPIALVLEGDRDERSARRRTLDASARRALQALAETGPAVEESALEVARRFLRSIERGQSTDLGRNRYYALTLSGAAGRVMVRDWMEGAFPDLVRAVAAWLEDFSIVRRDGLGLAPSPKFLAVLGALVRELDDVPAPLEARLWRSALRAEEPIPQEAVARALRRFTIDVLRDDPINHARAGLLKAALRRQRTITMAPYLSEDHESPAYHCGRLMAMYAALQYRALGDVGAGVVQRFYAAASATPALVLGRLARTAHFHLDKLDTGLARWHEARIAQVWARIEDRVPLSLTLEEQSLFALGYYQQIAADRSRAREVAMAAAALSTPDQEAETHA